VLARSGEDQFLELGLLLIVTGFFVGIFFLSLTIALGRESSIASSLPESLVTGAALSALLFVMFVLIRRVKRFVAPKEPSSL
jgi:hypothetical protein